MRTNKNNLGHKLISTFFAAALTLTMVPATALAQVAESNTVTNLSPTVAEAENSASENGDAAGAATLDDASAHADATENPATSDADDVEFRSGRVSGREGDSDAEDIVEPTDEVQSAISAVDVINQEVDLETVVAQTESTRSFFLAQTLESTRTVPIVSAKLPLDTSSDERAAQSPAPTGQPGSGSQDGSEIQPTSDGEDDGTSDEGGDGSDDPDLEGESQDDSVAARLVWQPAENTGLAPDSVVVGSFTYLGMTFAMEPGGETVALVAVDHNQLPEEFVQRQVIVIPEAAETSDGDMFSVTRIADGAFAGLTAESANQDYLGCDLLFSDEELLAEAGLTLDDVSEYLTPAAESDASLDGWVPDESCTYEEQDGSDSSEDTDDIRTIVSMEGNVATLDDGSTYTFENPLAGKAGILAVGIPASVTSVEEEALWGENLSLQYVVVSEDNQNYASYDGALYSADLSTLRSIPEGRCGALCVASSAISVDDEVFSHCPSLATLVADAEGGIEQVFKIDSEEYSEKRLLAASETSILGHIVYDHVCLDSIIVEAYGFNPSILVSGSSEPYFEEQARNDAASTAYSISGLGTVYVSGNGGKAVADKYASKIGVAGAYFYSDLDYSSNASLHYTSNKGFFGIGVNTTDYKCPNKLSGGNSPGSTFTGDEQKVDGTTGTFSYRGGNYSENVLSTLCYNTTYGFYINGSYHTSGYYGSQLFTTSGDWVKCRAACVFTASDQNYKILLTPPYTICMTWNPNGGTSFVSGGATRTSTYTLDSNIDENGTNSYTIAYPTSVTPATGKTFVGWNTSSSATVNTTTGWYYRADGKYSTVTTTKSSVTLYAIWQDGWTVTWNSNGGSTVSNWVIPVNKKLSDNTAGATSLPTPTRSGFTFDGWFLTNPNASSTNRLSTTLSDTAINANTNYYARWKIDFNWYPYSGASATSSVTKYSPGDFLTSTAYSSVYATTPSTSNNTPTGWELDQWSRSSTGDSNNVNKNTSVYAWSTDKTFNMYARWKASFTWSANNGTLSSSTHPTSLTAYGQTPTASTTVDNPSRTGYKFAGWRVDYTQEGLTDETVAAGTNSTTLTLKGSATITAQWTALNRAVKLDGNAGGDVADQYTFATYDAVMPSLAGNNGASSTGLGTQALVVPSRAGYDFNGYWDHPYSETSAQKQYYAANGTALQAYNNRVWQVTDDSLVLYAHWKYTIVLDMNVYNTDGDIVKNDAGDGFGASFGATQAANDVQTAMTSRTLSVPSKNGGANDTTVTGLAFTATDGAPIKLPQVQDRRGYKTTTTWKVTRGANGTASGNSVSSTAAATVAPTVGKPDASTKTLTLYSDWNGCAMTYDVDLVFTHDGFTSSTATIPLKVTYDQKIGSFTAATLTGATATAAAATGTDTLVYQGFYTTSFAKYSVNDTSHALNQGTARNQWYIDANGAATRAFREIPSDGTNGSTRIQLYALWGYPEVNILFDMQDTALTGTISGDVTDRGNGVYGELLVTNDAMPDVSALLARHKKARNGFTFTGFWDHPYNEGSGAKRYYDENGNCLYAGNRAVSSTEVTDATWDLTEGITLYAHWQYEVFLEPNVYNSSDEAVLNTSKDDYSMALNWPLATGFSTEQKDYSTSGGHVVNAKVQQKNGPASATESLYLKRYKFTAIDGAPIQLPAVVGRTGYADTRAWGTSVGANGAASNIMQYANNGMNVTAPFRATLVKVSDGTLGADNNRWAYVLYADWSGADGSLSGHAKTYTVQLTSTYTTANDSFKVADSALDAPTIKVTYDQPLDTSKFKEYATGGTRNYVDATRDSANASRNLVMKGFYRDKTSVEGPGTGNRVYVDVTSASGADAFTTAGLPFREISSDDSETTPIAIYALWAYNVTDITFDLQGGTIDNKDAATLGSQLTVAGVTSHSDTPGLTGVLATAPKRTGYDFAGWWNTPYNEATDEVVNGVTVTPRKYYAEDLSIPAENKTWLEFDNTTLYAHWKYTIEFDSNLDDVNDITDVTLDAVKTDNDQARVADTVPLSRASSGGPVFTDAYGNKYYETTTDTTGYDASGTYKDMRVTAIAGAPVKLPNAQLRRTQNSATMHYDRVGYNATWEWSHGENDTDALDYVTVEGNDKYFTLLADSWTGTPRAAGSLPCKIGGHTANSTLRLYAQWDGAKKSYDVQVLYTYDQDHAEADGSATNTHYAVAGHADARTFNVTYDEVNFTPVDGGLSFVSGTHDLQAADSSNVKATASKSGFDYEGLDFAGITTAGITYAEGARLLSTNDFFDSSDNDHYPTKGTKYWDANGQLMQTRFRAITGADVDIYNTQAAGAAYKPYPMYVAWAQPTREVTFNLFDQPSATDHNVTEYDELSVGNGATEPFTLQKGGSTTGGSADAAAKHERQLADLAQKVLDYQSESNYVFGGFWSAPQGESAATTYAPYEERAKHEAKYDSETPTCYYVLQGDKLVAAEPTTAADGTPDGWLTDENTSAVWLEDSDITLYAHWKYDLTLAVDTDDKIPTTNEELDMLVIGVADEQFSTASTAIDFADWDSTGQTDARGMLTYGAPLTMPMDGGGQDNAITRVRNFSSEAAQGYGETGLGRTGYTFAGWTVNTNRDANDAELYTFADAQDTPLRTSEFRPFEGESERGHVTLYAQWNAKTYQVNLQHRPSMYRDYITDESIKAPEDKNVVTINVRYDETFKQALARTGEDKGRIAPPALYGYDYLGYYISDDGRVNGTDVDGAGVQFFGPTVSADSNAPEFTGRSVATDKPWFAAVTANQSNANIYAYYERLTYTMTFDKLDEGDGTQQKLKGVSGNMQQVWRYNDKLWKDSTEEVATDTIDWNATLPSTVGYSRHGYNFEGWYILREPEGGLDSLSAEEQTAWRANKENRIYLYHVTGWNSDGTPIAQGISTVRVTPVTQEDGSVKMQETWSNYDSTIRTWSTPLGKGVSFDAERGYTIYAGWSPIEYKVTFDYNLQNGSDAGLKLERYYYFEDVIETPNPIAAGQPFTFLGWNERQNYEAYPGMWLLDKSDYLQHSDDGDTINAYSAMLPTKAGRFMPANEGNEIYLYGAWQEPAAKKIVMFSGSHGSLLGGNADQDGYKSVSHNFKIGWHIDNPSGLGDYRPAIRLSVDSGYEFTGWVELSPSDIARGIDGLSEAEAAAVKKYDEVDWDRVDAAKVIENLKVNTSNYKPKNTYYFPGNSKVTGAAAKGYTNPHTADKGVSYRDVYVVACYEKIDYTMKLDLGEASKYGYPDKPELGAKLDPTAPGGFTQPDPNAAHITYQRSFSMETNGDIIVPDVVSSNHRFLGWRMPDGKYLVDAAADGTIDWYDPATKTVDRAKFADYLKKGKTQTFTLSADWEERTYTVKFLSDHSDSTVVDGSEDIVLSGLSLDDEFTLPYPATRGQGSFFDYWSLLTTYDDDPWTGRFYSGDKIMLKDLLNAITSDGRFDDHSDEGSSEVGHVDVSNDTVCFDARWRETINVTVPIAVIVKVDPVNQEVLTADNLSISADYDDDSVNRTPVKVASLRYDRVEAVAGSGEYVFGTTPGKVHLSIYPDLKVSGDTTHLFRAENLNADGTLIEGVEGEQNPPLLIDLATPAVFSDKYPTNSGGTWSGLYENGESHAALEADPTHGLHSHGFRAFGSNTEEGVTLPIRYGLLFSDFAGLLDYAPKLGELASDTNQSFPIARLYYTIALDRTTSGATS